MSDVASRMRIALLVVVATLAMSGLMVATVFVEDAWAAVVPSAAAVAAAVAYKPITIRRKQRTGAAYAPALLLPLFTQVPRRRGVLESSRHVQTTGMMGSVPSVGILEDNYGQ
jgi:hypothetical protein